MDIAGTAAPPPPWRRVRLPLMALGLLSLLGALGGGLARLGWPLPTSAELAAFHGPLMVAGFLGTVIGLERAVAVGRLWAYAGPIATGLGAAAVMTGAPGGAWLMMLGSAVMVLASLRVSRGQALFPGVMSLGACAWLAGQVLWAAGWPMHRVVYWWIAFLVLTVADERLELSRRHGLDANRRAAFLGAIVLLLIGVGVTSLAPDPGARIAGAAMAAMATWLGLFDTEGRAAGTTGATRYVAVALVSGHAWLGVAGLLALWFGGVAAGPQYDAILHALFVGFVFSMIFGHAPVVFPTLLGTRGAYHPALYVPLGLLHASLALRVIGDCAPWWPARRWGALLNTAAIVLFFATMAYGLLASRRDPGPSSPGGIAGGRG